MPDKTATCAEVEATDASFTITVATEPLYLTADELAAAQRGERVTRSERIEAHPDFPGYEVGTTLEEYVLGEREQEEWKASGETIIEAGHDPSDPTWQHYCREAEGWREAILKGHDPGPKPEPPPKPVLRDDPSFRAHLSATTAVARPNGTPAPVRRAEASGTPRARQTSRTKSSSSDDPEPEPPAPAPARARGATSPSQTVIVASGTARIAAATPATASTPSVRAIVRTPIG